MNCKIQTHATQSRRDETLLTVGFNPRKGHSLFPSPGGTTLFRRIIPVIALFITAGCSQTFTLSVRNALTDEPLVDVLIERERESWYAPFVFAPGAVFYYLDSSNRTDQAGTIIYKGNLKKKNWFELHMPTNIPWDAPLRVKIGECEDTVSLEPDVLHEFNEKKLYNTGWSISTRRKNKMLYFTPRPKPCADTSTDEKSVIIDDESRRDGTL